MSDTLGATIGSAAPRWRVADRRRGALHVAGIATLVAADAVVVLHAGTVVQSAAAAVAYPFGLDFGEGAVLAATRAVLSHGAIYPPAADAAGLIANYPPLYYLTTAALAAITSFPTLAVGRALSLASALLVAALLAALVWRAVGSQAGAARLGAAVFGGCGFLQVTYTAEWAALMRVDLLALCLALVGVVAFTATAARGRHVYWCVLPFLLAFFTKQSSVAAAAACVAVLLRVDLHRGLRLAAALVAAVAIVAAALLIHSDGGFWFHVVTANRHPYVWEQTASFLQDVAIRYPVLLALALVAAPALWRSRQPRAERDPAASGLARAVLAAYLPCAVLTCLSVGKLGSDVNHLLELMGVLCALAAVAVGDALGCAPAAARGGWSGAVNALAIPALLLWQVAWIAPGSAIEHLELPPPAEQARIAALAVRIRATDGPILSEDLILLALADKPIGLQPFDGTQLAARGLRDEGTLVGAIAAGRIPLIVLRFDVASPPMIARTRFSAAVLEAIGRAYRRDGVAAGYWLYVPRSAGESAARSGGSGGAG